MPPFWRGIISLCKGTARIYQRASTKSARYNLYFYIKLSRHTGRQVMIPLGLHGVSPSLCSVVALAWPCLYYPVVLWEENSWSLVARCPFNCFMVVSCALWEETCLVCLPTAMQIAQYRSQPGNNHSNSQAKHFAFISQTRLGNFVAHLLPNQGARLYSTEHCHSPATAKVLHLVPLCSLQMGGALRAARQHHSACPALGKEE